jgi:DNA-binding XRE family transcriptional regulator
MRTSTQLLLEKIRECAEAGMTRDDTASAVGLCCASIVKYAHDYGIDFKRKNGGGPKKDRNAEICRRYLAGERQADLAQEYGISRERVRQLIERAGLVSETKRHDDFVAVVAGTVARKGLTLKEACEMFGLNRSNAYIYCLKHGVRPARMSAEEIAELDAMASEVEHGKSLRQAAERDSGKAQKLSRHLKRNGIAARGRSRHDDFTMRRRIIERCRADGLTWAEVAQKIAEHDARPIGAQAVLMWAQRHMPHLFQRDAA